VTIGHTAAASPADLAGPWRHLRIFMAASAAVYALGGIAFLALNDHLLQGLNLFGASLGLPPAALGDRFWLTLSGSMMMTIATCSYFAARDVRRHAAMCIPVIVSKAVSSAMGLLFFFTSGHVLAYGVVTLTDFPLFVATLWLYRRASRAG
jgi:hypothetical protein